MSGRLWARWLVSRLRLRPPSPVQSSPFHLCSVPCLCLPCCLLCSCSCVFPLFCPCSLSCLSSSAAPGFQPSLSAGLGWRLSLSLSSGLCPSQSCLCSCLCVVASKSCTYLSLLASGLFILRLLNLLPPNASSFLPCQSVAREVRWGVGVGGGVLGSCPCVVLSQSCPSKSPNALSTPQQKVTKALYLPNVSCWRPCIFSGRPSDSLTFVVRAFGGVRLGSICCPGRLSCGGGVACCRANSSRCSGVALVGGGFPLVGMLFLFPSRSLPAPSLDQSSSHSNLYTPMAIGSADFLCCCGDCVDAWMDGSGLSHAGEAHSSSSPDSAMDNTTPRKLSFKFGRLNCNCVAQENRLHVAKALGHPLVRMSLGVGSTRKSQPPCLRTQRPEQQPWEPHP